jgi:uncharacterized protein YuzE
LEVTLRFTYCSEARAFYIYISEGEQIAHTQTIIDEDLLINIDRDVDNKILGVEIVHP